MPGELYELLVLLPAHKLGEHLPKQVERVQQLLAKFQIRLPALVKRGIFPKHAEVQDLYVDEAHVAEHLFLHLEAVQVEFLQEVYGFIDAEEFVYLLRSALRLVYRREWLYWQEHLVERLQNCCHFTNEAGVNS